MAALLGSQLPRWQCSTMKTGVLMVLLIRRVVWGREDVRVLSELPFSELFAQKRMMAEGGSGREGAVVASALVGGAPREETRLKGVDGAARRKTFYEEEDEDGKGQPWKKKHEHKMHDVLNTSIMALSYLAFGGYLLCMIANALREKRRRYAMAYPSAGPTMSNQFAQVLQHYGHRPSRPFIRFPTVTVHQGGRKRRRRLAHNPPALVSSTTPKPLSPPPTSLSHFFLL